MLEVAVKFEKAFSRFDMQEPSYRIELESDYSIDGGVPDMMDWMKAKRMLSFLKIFYDITCKVSGSLYVTSNVFLHEIHKVHRLLKAWIDGRDEELSRMSKLMKDKFDKYWGDPKKMNKLIFIAVILDPRYKLKWVRLSLSKMYGESLGISMAKDLEAELIAMCNDYMSPVVPESGSEQKDIVMSTFDEEDVTSAALKEIAEEYVSLHNADGNEVDKFLKEDNESNSPLFDILSWWKMNSSRFPVLSQVARDVFAVPISTVASESAFSTGGRVLDEFRSSLTPTIVQYLICGQDWLRKSTTPVNVEELLEDIDILEQGLNGVTLEP